MGTTGVGLYANDMAMDLRSTAGAVARLPFDGNRLAEIIVESEASVANNPNDEDYSTFWLVVADQFAKRGIDCARVRETALGIIDSGEDLAMLARRGMKDKDLAKRKTILAELRERIVIPIEPENRRETLKKPQPFLMDVGDLFVYPTSSGKCINSYFKSKDKIAGWKHDGWSAAIIIDRGRAFDFLAWYRPLTLRRAVAEKPTLEQVRAETLLVARHPGTCSAVHFKRLELEKVGTVEIDPEKVAQNFPESRLGISQAVNDIGIVNSLSVDLPERMLTAPDLPPERRSRYNYPTIASLDVLMK
jgi:hypothetical protein